MNWGLVILITLAVLVIFLLLKFKEIRHKVGFLFVLALLLFMGATFAHIYLSSNVDMTTVDGVMTAGKLYMAWLGNFFGNIGKISGFVVNQDWGLNSIQSSYNNTGIK